MIEKNTQEYHFDNIHDYHEFAGLPAPEHPLLSISTIDTDTTV